MSDTKAARPSAWTSASYFAEGFPYTVVNQLPEILFKEVGASLQVIGLTALFHLPWNLKFLWGPFLDRYATKRKWLLALEALLVVILATLTVNAAAGNVLFIASSLFLVAALISATHDIAIDGFYLEALNEQDQSKYVGTRATAYRVAMLAVSGPLILLIGRAGWTAGFAASTAIMFGLLVWQWRFLPRVEVEERSFADLARLVFSRSALIFMLAAAVAVALGKSAMSWGWLQELTGSLAAHLPAISLSGWIGLTLLAVLLVVLATLPKVRHRLDGSDSFYAKAFVDFLAQDRITAILGFVILFRAGESFLLKMRYAFLRDIGITIEQYGLASGTFGVVASMAATIAAGWLISKHGLRRWIWPFVIAQNALNLLYAALASHYTDLWSAPGSGQADIVLVTTVIVIESIGSGLGTAVFMVFLMRCCRPGYKAAHMAIVTALMSVSFTLAGVASGFLASEFGFTNYFAFTFLATIPAMLLIFMLPHLDDPDAVSKPA